MTTTDTQSLVAILEKLNIKVNIIRRPTTLTKDAEGWEHWAWVVRLERFGSPYKYTEDIPYRMGSAHVEKRKPVASWMPKVVTPKAPDAATIVHSLILDSSACDESHADWCANFGYDEDSRKAMDIYLACQKSGTMLRKFLGKDLEAVKEAAQDY
jgi:hypothetical protein